MPKHRLILGRTLPFWGPYGGYNALRSGAKRCGDPKGAAARLSTPRNRYRILRYAAMRYTGKDQRT
jgi:hypothetical protein